MSKLVKDWFGRRAEEAYTFADDSKRLFDWDKGRSSYSSYFIDEKSSVKEAAQMIGSMFRVIGVPKHMKYSADLENSKNYVQVPLQMLRDGEGNFLPKDPQLLDAFYGAAIQNAALAAMQTDSDYLSTNIARDASRASVKNMLFSVLNIERIDKKLADRLPGYLKFVQKFKNHRYEEAPELPAEAPAQQRLMDLVVKMLRYPANISEADLEEFDKPLKSIERLLKKHGGIPNTADECSSMATSLAQIIYKYVEDPLPPPEEEKPSPEDSEGSGDDKGESAPASPPPPKPAMSKSELDDLAKNMLKSLINAEENEEDSGSFNKAFDDFSESMDESEKDIDFDFEQEGSAFDSKVTFEKAVNHPAKYKDVLEKVDVTKAAVLRTLLARKSKDEAFVVKSMRTGRFDTNKIAEARQNVPTVYERMGHISTNKICVGVLIDESGSMGGSKIDKAREAAIFINEVFKNMPDVNLFIYGHTADEDGRDSTQIRIYREKKTIVDKFTLGSVRSRSNNRDGDAILATAMRIRKFTQDQGILFVLSDGAPSASGYSGNSAINDTRQKVLKAQSKGFQVIQIAIEEHVPSDRMFDHFIKMTNIKNLPKDLTNYMSRKVDKMIKQTVTL